MFVPNFNKTAIINVDHIVKVCIEKPYLEQKDHTVVACLSFGQGTSVLHKGTADSCAQFLAEIYRTIG